jgi:hypothetical protein
MPFALKRFDGGRIPEFRGGALHADDVGVGFDGGVSESVGDEQVSEVPRGVVAEQR